VRAASLLKKDRLLYPLVMRPTQAEYFQVNLAAAWLAGFPSSLTRLCAVACAEADTVRLVGHAQGTSPSLRCSPEPAACSLQPAFEA
jgi:hypothetical protein